MRPGGHGSKGLEQKQIDQIMGARARALDDARPDAVAAAHAAGQLTARERLETLFDPDSIVEYGVLAGATSESDDDAPADGLVAAAGTVDGQPVVAASYDHTVRAGTQSSRNVRKILRLLYLANSHRWPFVCFVDGDGARRDDPLPPPPLLVGVRGRWDLYDGLAQLSGWAPTVAVVSGRSLDGHAGIAMLSDFVVATKGSEFGSLDEESGGEPTLRAVEDYAQTGDIDLICDDEPDSIAAVRKYLGFYLKELPSGDPSPALADIESIIPDNRRRPYDMRKVVAAITDAESTLELGPTRAPAMLTVLARMNGRTVGIFGSQPRSPLAGAIDAAAADKAARFIELCDNYEYPLVSLIDNPGYMVGQQAERDGIARHHARPLSALQHRSVPLCSVQLRKAYGLGPAAMSGFGSGRVMPDLRLSWPSVESGGMSLEGAAYIVKRKEIHAAKTPEEGIKIRDAYAEQIRDTTSGLRAGRTFTFDDVIHPNETRDRIGMMLGRMPRVLGDKKKYPIDPR